MVKKRILVTGATGLVGSHLLSTLCKEYELYALVRSVPDTRHAQVTYYEFDLAKGSLPATLPDKVDAVIHLAQSNNMRDFPLHALDIFNVNVNSTAQLLDYAQKAGATHFVYASTGGIYGEAASASKECAPVQLSNNSLGYYFSSKYAAEKLVLAYSNLLSVHILRPFFIYGKSQKVNMFIPRLLDNIKKGNPVTLQGENGILVNPVHVSDVVKLIAECLSINNSLTVNVAGPDVLSIREIADIMGEHLGKKPIYSMQGGDAGHVTGNNDLMTSLIKSPLLKFEKALADIL
jgi:nucleoside-diphosphate-sugar epimerase